MMRDKIIMELRRELDLLESTNDIDKHVYAMQRLLSVLGETEADSDSLPRTEFVKAPLRNISTVEGKDTAGGQGQDIFDF